MIVVVGLSHHTAPIAVREAIALPSEAVPELLRELCATEVVGEALIVSTCNRVELVAAGRSVDADLARVAEACASALCQRAPKIREHLYRHAGGTAVRHLFRVAASLDSLVLGEPQILGQLKQAYDIAREERALGPILNRTLPRALRVAKRVRTETSIGSGQVSVPSVAVDLARQIFGDFADRFVILIKSNEMAETATKQLHSAGARVVVVGRNLPRAQEVAQAVDGEGRGWSELGATLAEADVVITSTSAKGYVIDYELVAAARKKRRGQNQFLIDLAVPRDIDPRVEKLDGVYLYNVDDLTAQVQQSLSARSREAERAEAIVVSEALGYDRWADAEQATPTIVALRARLRAALDIELNRSLKGRLRHLGEEDRSAMTKMMEASINRVLHGPTLKLRQAALSRSPEALSLDQLAAAVGELFQLSQGESLTDDAEMPAYEEPLASGPDASPAEPETETSVDDDAPAGKRRAHSEAP
ncbi:MAG TPA: glutamyl-tRNA reductase [Polyangiaceae bacterium]|nr:glutamyl-tRNA reductase [Polyangiaceae bacterium]